MEKIKIIFKGILVWFTAFMTFFVISAIDGIADKYGIFGILLSIFMIGAFVSMCYAVVSYNDLKVVTGYDTFNKMLGIGEDEDDI